MGRINILAYGYRNWALDTFHILNMFGYELQIEKDKDKVDKVYIASLKPDLILFYGWSWIVPDWLTDKYIALCLHPSPLPKYRGGSPIQHQILNGEKESAVSIFRLTKDIDEGPLCSQVKYSLAGNMDNILARIRYIAVGETKRIIEEYMNGGIKFWDQEGTVTICNRREPYQSEITKGELQSMSAEYLYNKIRGLQDPYPNAFITCADGQKLYLTEAHCG